MSTLLRRLLFPYLCMPVVEAGGGGAAVVEEAVIEDEPPQDGGADESIGADESGDGDGKPEGEQQAGGQADDEIVVSIGDEPGPDEEDEKRAPEWVRDLRKSNREKDRRIRELEAKVATATPTQQAIVLGEKPTLDGCDYDAEKFERELEAWHNRKRDLDDQQRQRAQTEEQQCAQWQGRIDAVKTAATGLKVKDYDDAAQSFEDTFSMVQQGIVIGGPEDPKSSALLRYALGKNPKKAKELAAITDPVKFTFAVARLEAQLKITPRKSAPAPDSRVRSSVAGAAAVDSQLQRLRDEAAKTGNMSKVIAYKNEQRAKQRA